MPVSRSPAGDGSRPGRRHGEARRRLLIVALAAGVLALAAATGGVHAAQNPFAVAGNEGAVDPGGIGGWLLAQQTAFYKMITGTVRAAKTDGSALWLLAGISFAYGVFHAAGPGHGKAVVASYMVANERALKRGLIISFLAAVLQGLVAVAIVVLAAVVLRATAARMTQAAGVIELVSYAGVALLGACLVWRKGARFVAALGTHRRAVRAEHGDATAGLVATAHLQDHAHAPGVHFHVAMAEHTPPQAAHGHHEHDCGGHDCGGHAHHAHDHAEHGHAEHGHDHAHVHDEHCGHFHAPDPATLGEGFSWRAAALTVVAAGARPCSGAILVLVFSLAQGILFAGIAATFAMSLGTAITTGVLAATAVLFKGVAVRLLGAGSARREIVARGVEVLAALAVLLVGVGLLFGAWGMAAGA